MNLHQFVLDIVLIAASFVLTMNIIIFLRLRRLWKKTIQLKANMEITHKLMTCVVDAALEDENPPIHLHVSRGANIH